MDSFCASILKFEATSSRSFDRLKKHENPSKAEVRGFLLQSSSGGQAFAIDLKRIKTPDTDEARPAQADIQKLMLALQKGSAHLKAAAAKASGGLNNALGAMLVGTDPSGGQFFPTVQRMRTGKLKKAFTDARACKKLSAKIRAENSG